MNSIEQLWASFKRRNVAEQIIGLNLLLFILLYLFNSFAFVMGLEENYLLYYLSLKADLDLLIFQPWTLITYGFVHEGFLHILFNMILLYYFGQLFLDFFDRGSFIRYYLIGILMGGLIYLIAYNFFPGLKTMPEAKKSTHRLPRRRARAALPALERSRRAVEALGGASERPLSEAELGARAPGSAISSFDLDLELRAESR